MNSQYFESLFTAIMENERYRGELVAAKEEFEPIAGQMMESDESFDARINAFHNWYILDRPMTGTGMTPLRYYLEFNANVLSEEVVQGYRDLYDNVHSLFELLKFNGEAVYLRDLISRKKYVVEGARQLDSLERGDLFNTRVFRHGKKSYLTNYLLIHPAGVARIIRAEAKKVRKAKEDPKPFLLRLLFFHSRWEQFTQMDEDKIYRFQAPAHEQPAVSG